jgi:hypothetical protein
LIDAPDGLRVGQRRDHSAASLMASTIDGCTKIVSTST